MAPVSDNVNASDPDGWTPIQRATRDNKLELMKLLAPSVENLMTPDPEGFTPVQRVQKRKREIDEAWDFVKSISKDVIIEHKQLQEDQLDQSVCLEAKKVEQSSLEGSNMDKQYQNEQVSKRSKIVDKVSLFF